MYATIALGAITRYPADPVADNPTTSFAAGWQGGIVGGVEYVAVAPSPQPAYDPLTQDCAEATPVLDNGVWLQQWAVTTASADEQAARLAQQRANMTCTPRQVRLALMQADMLDAVNAAIAAAGSAAQIEWDYATSIRRDHPLIAALMASLGKTEDEVDALFIAAAAL